MPKVIKANGKAHKYKKSYNFFTEHSTNFNVLPARIFHPIIYTHLKDFPRSLSQRFDYMKKFFPVSGAMTLMQDEEITLATSKKKSLAIRAAVNLIQRHRHLFRTLLHHMRAKRLSSANSTDLLTMEIPKKPVYIVDWPARKSYVFEAQTLMKDITLRITNHDGFFEDSQPPRNPFTNTPLTQSQMISVWNSISHAGIIVSSAFSLFRKARYCIKIFNLENSVFLKLNALKATMKDPSAYDYVDRMTDFIHFAYESESIDCDTTAFRFAMREYPNHVILLKWRDLCYRYYSADILHSGNTARITQIKDYALDDSYDLLDSQVIFTRLFLAHAQAHANATA